MSPCWGRRRWPGTATPAAFQSPTRVPSPCSFLGGDRDPAPAQLTKLLLNWPRLRASERDGQADRRMDRRVDRKADEQQREPQAEQSSKASSGEPLHCIPLGVTTHPQYIGDLLSPRSHRRPGRDREQQQVLQGAAGQDESRALWLPSSCSHLRKGSAIWWDILGLRRSE